ncbi:transposase [Deinococcus radiopugnans]|uniref:transposase n=1 Tax=Deinococcus radiopugnans TaxID=57497 RepID=UPI0036150A25
MSLKDSHPGQVPEETARVAKAVFRKGHRYLTLRDTFGDLFDSDDFRSLFHLEGRPAIDPAQLALVTLVQFVENLSDERAADAVRARIDLKYLLALPLDHPGFDASVLSEFRTRLIEGQGEHLLFERLLERFRAQQLLRARGQQRTDSTHVLAAVRALNRVSLVGEAFRHALNVLAIAAPEWLVQHGQKNWAQRYASHFDLTAEVAERQRAKREALLLQLGADGKELLEAVLAQDAPRWLCELPAIQILWRVWLQNFTPTEVGTLRWRTNDEIPPAQCSWARLTMRTPVTARNARPPGSDTKSTSLRPVTTISRC